MKPKMASRFLERIYNTREEELDCGGLMQVIDRYVEIEAAGDDGSQVNSEVPHHLAVCADCAELVATLTQLVALEDAGELPPIDSLWGELEEAADGNSGEAGSPPGAGGADNGTSVMGRLKSWLGRPQLFLLGPVVVAMVVVMTAAGWWQATAKAEAATAIVDELGVMDTVRTVEMPDGGTIRVFYDPHGTRMLIHSCDLKSDDDFDVDLLHHDGRGELAHAHAVHSNQDAHDWWTVDCSHPIGEYESLSMNQGRTSPATLKIGDSASSNH